MTEHEFTLVIDGDLADEKVADTLFEVGCDDATFGIIDGIGYGEFIREASTFADAVMDGTPIRQVESVAGLRVMHIEPDDIVTMTDIAERLDRTRESVRLLIAGQRGPVSFPPPKFAQPGAESSLAMVGRGGVAWPDRIRGGEIDAIHGGRQCGT